MDLENPSQQQGKPQQQQQATKKSSVSREYSSKMRVKQATQQIRRDFIRKVYAILLVQLSITIGFIALCVFVQPIKDFVQSNPWMVWLGFGLTIFLMIVLSCFPKVRYSYPGNFIALFLFTLSVSYLLGTVASFYDSTNVLVAAGITGGIVLGLTIFTFQSKLDFSKMAPFLFAFMLGIFWFGIFFWIYPSNGVSVFWSALIALLFCFLLIYDTYSVIERLSIDEYIGGALDLYVDIIVLFLAVLGLSSR